MPRHQSMNPLIELLVGCFRLGLTAFSFAGLGFISGIVFTAAVTDIRSALMLCRRRKVLEVVEKLVVV